MSEFMLRALLFLLFISFTNLSKSQLRNSWPVIEKAALIGYLFNPGYTMHSNDKFLQYECFYGDNYLKKDSLLLVKKAGAFFNLFHFFVAKQQHGLIDTVFIKANNLQGLMRYEWGGS